MRSPVIGVVVILALTAAVFAPVATHQFIVLDDPDYLTGNPAVQRGLSPGSVAWAFTTFDASNWHPLTWLSHLLDVELFGFEPRGHHLMNVLVHGVAASALFVVLRRHTGVCWPSLLVTLGFAVHPLRVESVAWASERKDVLSALLWMLALAAHLHGARRPGRARRVALVAVFALGLMAKPMLVTLPLVLLFLDFWPLGRLRGRADFGRLLLEKAPLIALSAVSAAVTLKAQAAAMVPVGVVPVGGRLANAATSAVAYLGKTLWPASLAFHYPGSQGGGDLYAVFAALLLLLAAAGAVQSRGRRPFVLAGCGWYAVTLLPVLGIVQVGDQSMADRYTYIPSVGAGIAAVWLLRGWVPAAPRLRVAVAAAAAVVILAWGAIAGGYVRVWRDGVALFGHALQVTRGNWLAHKGLAIELSRRNRLDEAVEQYRRLVELRPDDVEARYSLGHACQLTGDLRQAAEHYRRALEIKPDHFEAHNNLGVVLANGGRMGEAAEHFRAALSVRPGDTGARENLVRALAAGSGR